MADMTLMEFIRNLIFNDDAREDFAADPEGALDDAGLGHLSADDVHDALALMQEDNQEADFSRDYETGGNEINIAAPAPVSHDDGGGSESAAEYINQYITNNYVDDRDTTVDNSVNQQIDTGGGDFDQNIDVDSTVASGDGAVAAGDDIEDSNIVTGDDNVVGDGNVSGEGNVVGDGNQTVNGDGNTSSFGEGDAISADIDGNVNVGDGAGFALGGDVSVDNTDNSVSDSNNDYSDNSMENVGNDYSETTTTTTDNSDNSTTITDNTDNSTNDSFNDSSDNSTSDSFNDNSEYSDDDSHSNNVESDDDSYSAADDSSLEFQS